MKLSLDSWEGYLISSSRLVLKFSPTEYEPNAQDIYYARTHSSLADPEFNVIPLSPCQKVLASQQPLPDQQVSPGEKLPQCR